MRPRNLPRERSTSRCAAGLRNSGSRPFSLIANCLRRSGFPAARREIRVLGRSNEDERCRPIRVAVLDAVEILEARGVDYAVVGAMAMAVHGVVRASLDADADVRASPGQLDGLAREFADRGLKTDLGRGEEGDPIRAVFKVSDSHENAVDLIAGLHGVKSGVFRRAVGIRFEGSTIRVVAREDLIAMKLFAGGPVDLDDARRLVDFAGDELNLALLRSVTPDYGPDAVANLERLLSPS